MSIIEFLRNLAHVDPLLCATMALAVVAVIFSIAAYRRSGKRRDEAMILQCMTHYNDVRRVKANAIMTGSQSLAEVYYANLFDLMWVEFKLWLEGRVNNAMMLEWMNARYQDYAQNDGILVSRMGPGGRTTRRVSYPEEWARRVRSSGADARRPAFFEFMDLTHEGALQKAIGGKKRFRKNRVKSGRVKPASVGAADEKKHSAPQSPVAAPAGVVMGSAAGGGSQEAGGAGQGTAGMTAQTSAGTVVQAMGGPGASGEGNEAQGTGSAGTIYVAPSGEATDGTGAAGAGSAASAQERDRAG